MHRKNKMDEQDMLVYKKVNVFLKKITDIICGVLGLVISIPITLILFIANLCSKQYKLFYVQKRIGKNGELFNMYKFNSMVPDSDIVLKKYLKENPEAMEEYTKYKKLKNDPRITKMGKILRKTSLDELPQFINILKGEMSIVGPRPYLPKEKEEMGESFKVITSVKPGLTGPWQVGGRNKIPFEKRIALESEYAKNNNVIKDFKILLKTILVVFKQEGVY